MPFKAVITTVLVWCDLQQPMATPQYSQVDEAFVSVVSGDRLPAAIANSRSPAVSGTSKLAAGVSLPVAATPRSRNLRGSKFLRRRKPAEGRWCSRAAVKPLSTTPMSTANCVGRRVDCTHASVLGVREVELIRHRDQLERWVSTEVPAMAR